MAAMQHSGNSKNGRQRRNGCQQRSRNKLFRASAAAAVAASLAASSSSLSCHGLVRPTAASFASSTRRRTNGGGGGGVVPSSRLRPPSPLAAYSSSSSASSSSSSPFGGASAAAGGWNDTSAAAAADSSFYPFANGAADDDGLLLDAYLVQDLGRQRVTWLDFEGRNNNNNNRNGGPLSSVREVDNGDGDNRETAVASDAPAKSADGKGEGMVARARILLLVAAALYGTNFSFVKLLGQSSIPVGASSTLRFGIAALSTLPWLLPKGDSSGSKPSSLSGFDLNSPEVAAAIAGFEVGMWNSVGYVAQAVGLETTPASQSAFLCSLAVVVVPILDLIAGKPMLARQAAGTVAALLGVAILELGLPGEVASSTADWSSLSYGDVASLVQPLAFGMGFWRMEKAMHSYPNQAMRSTAAQLLAVFLASGAYTLATDPGSLTDLGQLQDWLTNPTILAGLVWTGAVTTALTIYMETVALETLSAAETTLIFSTEPLWGTACAAAVMGEQLGLDAGVGALLILSGCLFANLGVDGIKSLLGKKKKGDNKKESTETETAAISDYGTDKPTAAASRIAAQVALFRTTATAATTTTTKGGAVLEGAWNELAVGAKVTALQLESLLQELLPEEWLVDF